MASIEPPVRLTFQVDNEFWDALSSLVVARFVSGGQSFAETFKVTRVARASDLLPLDAVRFSVTEPDTERVFADGDGWSALVERTRNGAADVAVTAVGAEELAKAVADIRSRSPLVEPKPHRVDVDFWYGSRNHLREVTRRIDVPAWDRIAPNYTAAVREQVAALVDMPTPVSGGRLVLWHGPPGTGKTTAIRALVRGWAAWCRTLFVVDAERFLGDAGYLMSVLLGADDFQPDDETPRWRLLVFEDADELMRADAKRESGQSLSRLLSLSDGFIGQGVNVLVLITTNEPIGRLHPAVVRPGRCLAEVEFRALTRDEASALLGSDAGGDLTLAEVFERRGQSTRMGARADAPPTGQYL